MHVSSGRSGYGFFLAFFTMVLWGILPIKLKLVLVSMDALTVTWYRVLVCGILLFFYLLARRQLPSFHGVSSVNLLLLAVCVLGLIGNYVLYAVGLSLLSAETTQLVYQLSPFLLLIASVIVFKESFGLGQWLGLIVLLLGFVFFFNERLEVLFSSKSDYSLGIITIILACVVWACYGLAQKQLLTTWTSVQIMLVIYVCGIFMLWPWSHPMQIKNLDLLQLILLLACCFNTLFAYGAFAESLAHLEASKVSATVAACPIITFVTVEILSYFWPDVIVPDKLNLLAYIGVLMVVCGSVLASLWPIMKRRWQHLDTVSAKS